MADTTMTDHAGVLLERTSHIPITQLTPLLPAPSSRSLKATVTLTWPYSSATGAIAFLLAEPDFRLRRTRGQVRVQFSGSSAKAVAKAGIASGDEVTLCLDGVEWLKEDSANGTPGRGVECELKFTERLLLQFRPEDSQQINLIDIDHPIPESDSAQVPPSSAENRIPSPESPAPQFSSTARPDSVTDNNNEWSSPAFIKRARTSYGSLFDTSYDPFEEEDGTVPGKGRKRIKSSRMSRQWRYTSRTPSPEVEEPEEEPAKEASPEPVRMAPTTPAMTDEASQTIDLEDGTAAETLANFSRQSTTVGEGLVTAEAILNFAGDQTVIETQGRTESPSAAENPAIAISLPTFSIDSEPDMESSRTQAHEDHFQEMEFGLTAAQQPPLSPRLQPLSSDGLPLVSPLAESRPGPFGAPSAVGPLDFGQSWNDQPSTSITFEEATVADKHEGIYSTASTVHVDEQPTSGFERFQEAAIGSSNMGPLHLEAQPDPANQYGHWQSVNDVLNRSMSPHKVVVESSDDFRQQIYGEDGHAEESNHIEDQYYESHDISAIQPASPPHDSEDGGAQGEIVSKPWGSSPGQVEYPDLPSPKDDLEYDVEQPTKYQGSAAISRSQSQQSQAIDLTEDSDEEDEDEEDRDTEASFDDNIDEEGHGPQSRAYSRAAEDNQISGELQQAEKGYSDEIEEDDEDNYDRDVDADNGSEYEMEENENVHVDGRDFDGPKSGYRGSNQEEYSEGEEYEEDYEGPLGYHSDPQNDFEEEEDEEGYDDDDDDDEAEEDFEDEPSPARPPPPQAPVVIDLLSSDDEDDSEQVNSQDAHKAVAVSRRGDFEKDAKMYREEQSDSDEMESDDDATHSPEPEPESAMADLRVLAEKSYGEFSGQEPASEDDTHDPNVNKDDSVESESAESIEDDEDTEMAQPEVLSIDEATTRAGDLEQEGQSGQDDDNDQGDVVEEPHDDDRGVIEDERVAQSEAVKDMPELEEATATETRPSVEDGYASADEIKTAQESAKQDSGEKGFVEKEAYTEDGDAEMADQLPVAQELEQDSGAADKVAEAILTEDKDDIQMPQAEAAITDDDQYQGSTSVNAIENEAQVEAEMPDSKSSPLSHESDRPTDEASQHQPISPPVDAEQLHEDFPKDAHDNHGQTDEAAVMPIAPSQPVADSDIQESNSTSSTDMVRPKSSRQFSLDGASDEHSHDIFYPILPANEIAELPVTEQDLSDQTDLLNDKLSKPDVQLPTPDATQVSQTITIQEGSSTSITNFETAPHTDVAASDIAGTVRDKFEPTTLEEASSSKTGIDHDETRDHEAFPSVIPEANIEDIDDFLQQSIREDQSEDEKSPEPDIKDLEISKTEVVQTVEAPTTKSTEDIPDVAPSTPVRRSARNVRTTTPSSSLSNFSVLLDERLTPRGYDASIELAMSELDSPTKSVPDVQKPNDTALKFKLKRALRTELSEFTPLKMVRYQITKKIDVLAIATTSTPEPQRAKAGPRHYHFTFKVTDASIGPSHVTEVQVFRPYKDALPIVKAGDGILLRNFQVISVKGGFALRSEQTETSSWAVFKGEQNEVDIRGPPVEYGSGEKEHIASLKGWYEGLDSVARAKIDRANGDKVVTGVKTRATSG